MSNNFKEKIMKRIITFTLLISTLMLGCSTKAVSGQKLSEHYYSVISMQINNLNKFKEYRQKTKKLFQSAGGKILRDFDVVGAPKGPIQYGEVSRVSLVEFNSETGFKKLSKNPDYKKYQNLLNDAASNQKLMSGSTHKPYSAKSGELFILKISNYKKQDGQAQKVANGINQRLQKKYDFYNDTQFKISELEGLHRADDVGIFLYKKSSGQEKLYKDKNAMESIGKFNKTFLDGFVYLALRPIR